MAESLAGPDHLEDQLSLEGIARPDDKPLRVPVLNSAEFDVSADGESLLKWQVDLAVLQLSRGKINTEYKMSVPEWYFRTSGLSPLERESVPEGELVRFDVTMNGLLPILVTGKFRSRSGKKTKRSRIPRSFMPLPPEIANPIETLLDALTQVHYIGPLRAPAKRYYITNVESAPSIDSAGEFLPYVLKYRGSDLVRCPSPYESTGKKLRALRVVLDEWVHFLRTGDRSSSPVACREVDIQSQGDVLSEFMLRSTDGEESHALADSGFGYSQVLPILVRGLIARPGETIIIEQPELHLNPALQVRVAEFFVALVNSGRQVLLETHSEHIVNAIRVLAAEDTSGQMWEKSSILFVDIVDGRPDVKQLQIAADGTVPEWPATFFGEAMNLSTRLLLAQTANRTAGSAIK
jgi:hypothetical protein